MITHVDREFLGYDEKMKRNENTVCLFVFMNQGRASSLVFSLFSLKLMKNEGESE